MEKLGQLHAEAVETGSWDLIVVDTPPARSALDFLDAPEHLSSLLDGRFLKVLLAGARGPFRLVSVGFNLVAGACLRQDHKFSAKSASPPMIKAPRLPVP